jgi:hypothetical protein
MIVTAKTRGLKVNLRVSFLLLPRFPVRFLAALYWMVRPTMPELVICCVGIDCRLDWRAEVTPAQPIAERAQNARRIDPNFRTDRALRWFLFRAKGNMKSGRTRPPLVVEGNVSLKITAT